MIISGSAAGRTALVGLVVGSLSGCYSFTGGSVPAHLRTIAIPLVDDRSGYGEPGLREQFTQDLTNLFLSDNSLQVADRSTADAILEGNILAIADAPAVVQSGEQVRTRRVTVSAKFTLQDMKMRRRMWEKTFSNWGEYEPGGERMLVARDCRKLCGRLRKTYCWKPFQGGSSRRALRRPKARC